MSGHSKWSTIKRKKAINDQAKGKVFSKLSKIITIAVKTGGGPNPEMNPKLKVAIDAAKAANMPKENIDRAISKADTDAASLEEVTYEGFGPGGVGIIVEATTDNRNRTVQEIKQIFDKNGGTLGTPNSVAFNFDTVGAIVLGKAVTEDEMLTLIDAGVEDIQTQGSETVLYMNSTELANVRSKVEAAGFETQHVNIVRRPKMLVNINESDEEKLRNMLDILEDHDDVQDVFVNAG